MAKFPNLAIRGAKYYFRRKVPEHLIHTIGKTNWVKSLGSVDLKEAERLLIIERAATNKEIQQAELQSTKADLDIDTAKGLSTKILNKEIAQQLALLWFDERRSAIQGDFYSDPKLFSDEKAKRSALKKCEARLAKYHKGTAKSVMAHLNKQASNLLKKYNYKTMRKISSPHSITFRLLLDELRRAECNALIFKCGLLGDADRYDKAMRDYDSTQVQVAHHEVDAKSKANSLGDLIDTHKLSHKEKGKSLSSHKKWEVIYTILTDIWGRSKPLKSITRADCRDELKSFFMDCPVNAKKKFPTLNYKQIWDKAVEGELVGLSAKTINDKLAYVSTLFKFACNEDLMDKNPANNLSVAKGEVSASRVPFEQDELKKLFAAPPFDKEKGTHYFILMLALYQGMRSNEICQLLTSDIRKEAGIWCVEISKHSESGKSIKTDASARTLPIHSKVIEAGFIKFFEKRKKGKRDRLFHELKADEEGSYSNSFRGWFRRHQKRAEVTTDKKSMHSFRHTFETASMNAGVDLLTVKLLMGHKIGAGITDTYYHGQGLKVLQVAIEKVGYDLGINTKK